jgi:hypothetical protein
MGKAYSTYGGNIFACRVSVGNLREGIYLERPRIRWENTIKMDLIEVGRGRYWIYLAQDKSR